MNQFEVTKKSLIMKQTQLMKSFSLRICHRSSNKTVIEIDCRSDSTKRKLHSNQFQFETNFLLASPFSIPNPKKGISNVDSRMQNLSSSFSCLCKKQFQINFFHRVCAFCWNLKDLTTE